MGCRGEEEAAVGHDAPAGENLSDATFSDLLSTQDEAAGPLCEEGEFRCLSASTVERCSEDGWTYYKMCNSPMSCDEGVCVIPETCNPGQSLGCTDETTIKRCNMAGNGITAEPCPQGEYCLNGECGDQVCIPGTAQCLDSETLHYCNPEGTAYLEPSPCGEGALCINNQCLSGCMVDYKFGSYVGCEYWTVDLDQYEDPFTNPEPQPHAVVISNPGLGEASIQFES